MELKGKGTQMKVQQLLESQFEDEAVESVESEEIVDEYPDAQFPGEDIGWILFRRDELAYEKSYGGDQ